MVRYYYNGNQYSSINDIIKACYGVSVEDYNAVINTEKNAQKYVNIYKNKEDIISFLQNDYFEYYSNFKKDTSKVIDLYMRRLDTLANLDSNQFLLLKEILTKRIESHSENTRSVHMLMKTNIDSSLKTVLTEEQYVIYSQKQIFYSRVTDLMKDRILKLCMSKGDDLMGCFELYPKTVFGSIDSTIIEEK